MSEIKCLACIQWGGTPQCLHAALETSNVRKAALSSLSSYSLSKVGIFTVKGISCSLLLRANCYCTVVTCSHESCLDKATAKLGFLYKHLFRSRVLARVIKKGTRSRIWADEDQLEAIFSTLTSVPIFSPAERNCTSAFIM